jgi:hypothetical protein
MPHPKSPHAYEDIRRAFDLALANNGARRICTTGPEAMKWRHRAHRFRNALRTPIDGIIPPTPYDTLVLRIAAEEPHIVMIAVEVDMGQMETLDGQPLVTDMDAREIDPLLEEAREMARSLGIEL